MEQAATGPPPEQEFVEDTAPVACDKRTEIKTKTQICVAWTDAALKKLC